MQLGATKFFSELGNVGSDYDHPPHSRKHYNAWLSGLGSRGSPITVRPETKRKYTPTQFNNVVLINNNDSNFDRPNK